MESRAWSYDEPAGMKITAGSSPIKTLVPKKILYNRNIARMPADETIISIDLIPFRVIDLFLIRKIMDNIDVIQFLPPYTYQGYSVSVLKVLILFLILHHLKTKNNL